MKYSNEYMLKIAKYFGIEDDSAHLVFGSDGCGGFGAEYSFEACIGEDYINSDGGVNYEEGPYGNSNKFTGVDLHIKVADDGMLVRIWASNISLSDSILEQLEKYKEENDYKHGVILHTRYKNMGPACIGYIDTTIKDEESAINKLSFNMLCHCLERMMDTLKIIANIQHGLDYNTAKYFKNSKLIYYDGEGSEIKQTDPKLTKILK